MMYLFTLTKNIFDTDLSKLRYRFIEIDLVGFGSITTIFLDMKKPLTFFDISINIVVEIKYLINSEFLIFNILNKRNIYKKAMCTFKK